MPDDADVDARVIALEGEMSRVGGEIYAMASEVAMARLLALEAQHALARTRREIGTCRSWLTELQQELLPTQTVQHEGITFVIQRLDRALGTA